MTNKRVPSIFIVSKQVLAVCKMRYKFSAFSHWAWPEKSEGLCQQPYHGT